MIPDFPSFQGMVALVAGATSGVGRATAVAFAASGARTLVAGRRDLEGRATVAQIEAAGGEATFVACDVRRDRYVAALVEAAVAHYGGLDFAVNNASVEAMAGVTDATEREFDEVMATDAKGVFLRLKHELRHMRAHGGGFLLYNAGSP